jgi:Sensors of blue-light using FAD
MPSGALHRIVYMSTAVGVLRAEELDRIYLRAQAANARADITGLMLFYEGVFLQVLEGPVAGVTSLVEKIRRDRRHSGFVVLESGAASERNFGGSAMNFVSARKLSAGEKQAFSELRQAVSARGASSGLGLSDLLAAFGAVRTA